MELTLEGDTSIHVEGSVTIDLPSYMKVLTAEELHEAISFKASERIVAAGEDPNSHDVVFLTNRGTLYELSAEEQALPATDAYPIDFGDTLQLRLDELESFNVSAEWAIENSRMIINLGVFATKEGAKFTYVSK